MWWECPLINKKSRIWITDRCACWCAQRLNIISWCVYEGVSGWGGVRISRLSKADCPLPSVSGLHPMLWARENKMWGKWDLLSSLTELKHGCPQTGTMYPTPLLVLTLQDSDWKIQLCLQLGNGTFMPPQLQKANSLWNISLYIDWQTEILLVLFL